MVAWWVSDPYTVKSIFNDLWHYPSAVPEAPRGRPPSRFQFHPLSEVVSFESTYT
jgi:hypothetical protein